MWHCRGKRAVLALPGCFFALALVLIAGAPKPAHAVSAGCDALGGNGRAFNSATGSDNFTIPAAPYVARELIGATIVSGPDTSVTITFSGVAFTVNGPGPAFQERDVPADSTFAINIQLTNAGAAAPATVVISCDDSSVILDGADGDGPDAPNTLAAQRDSINNNTRNAHNTAFDRMNGGHLCALCTVIDGGARSQPNSGALRLAPSSASQSTGNTDRDPYYLGKDLSRGAPAPRRPQQWTAFASGGYADGDVSATANQAGFNFDSYWGTVGVDRFIGNTVIVGAATTFSRLEGDFKSAGGSNDTDTTTIMAYAGWQPNQLQYVNAVISQGFSSVDQVRRVTGAGTAKGDTDADTTAASVRIGGDVPVMRRTILVGGALGADIVHSEIDGYRERSFGAAAFIVPEQDATSALLSVTGRIARPWFTDWGNIVPYASITYAHELADDRDVLTVTTVATSINSTAILDDPDQEAWTLGCGLYMQTFSGSSAGVSVTTSLGDQELEQTAITLRGRIRFGGGR